MSIGLRKKYISITLGMVLLFYAGHHYMDVTPIGMLREMLMVNHSVLLGGCLFGTFFLMANAQQDMRSRKMFALQMLLIGLATGFTLIRILMQYNLTTPSSRVMSPEVLIYGNIYAFIMLMYPFEWLYPGRMAYRRYALFMLPALLTGLIYYGYIRITGFAITDIGCWSDLAANFHRFDVWFRLLIFIYPAWMFSIILRQRKRYITEHPENVSNAAYSELGWLDDYLFGYLLVSLSYTIIVWGYKPQSILINSLCFLVFFGFAFYRTIRQEVADAPQCSIKPVSWKDPIPSCVQTDIAEDKYRFVDKMPEYKIMLERWMETEKPYLNKDFKLLDVMQALPLNRSYISRMFNEAYGETFFCFVMRYRIQESMRMLETCPDYTVACIAQICGFSSPSVFGRAFLKNTGMTPKEYRNSKLSSKALS